MAENTFNLENFVRAYLEFDSKDFWNGLTNRYLDNGWQGFDETRWKVPESVQPIVDVIKGAQDKPEANEYAKTIRFVTAVYSAVSIATDESATKMLLNRIKQFQDQDLAYNALVKLKGMTGYNHPVSAKYNSYHPLSKEIAKMLANNKNATADDIAELVYFCKTPQEAIQILNDVCVKVDENIETEMKRDLPDVSKIQNLVSIPKDAMRTVGSHMQMTDAAPEYIDNVNSLDRQERMALNARFTDMAKLYKSKYNYDKIIESGDTEYIAKYDESVMTKNIELQETANNAMKNSERLEQVNKDRVETIERQGREIENLKEQFRDYRERADAEKARLERDKQMLRGKLKLLEELAGKARGGLGAKGIDELRKAIENANAVEI